MHKQNQPLQCCKQAEKVLVPGPAAPRLGTNIHFLDFLKLRKHCTSSAQLRLSEQMALDIWQPSIRRADSIQMVQRSQSQSPSMNRTGDAQRDAKLSMTPHSWGAKGGGVVGCLVSPPKQKICGNVSRSQLCQFSKTTTSAADRDGSHPLIKCPGCQSAGVTANHASSDASGRAEARPKTRQLGRG